MSKGLFAMKNSKCCSKTSHYCMQEIFKLREEQTDSQFARQIVRQTDRQKKNRRIERQTVMQIILLPCSKPTGLQEVSLSQKDSVSLKEALVKSHKLAQKRGLVVQCWSSSLEGQLSSGLAVQRVSRQGSGRLQQSYKAQFMFPR